MNAASPVIDRARTFACDRMGHLCRSNKARQPITEHLAEVAMLVETAGGDDAALAAAWLHDVVEDTETTLDEIRAHFGEDVARLVDGLTDPADFAALPLALRKQKQTDRLQTHPDKQLFLIKLSDQISNVRCVLTDPPLDNWNDQTSLDYVNGAKTIAAVCAGQSQLLDKLFADVCRKATEKYAAAPAQE